MANKNAALTERNKNVARPLGRTALLTARPAEEREPERESKRRDRLLSGTRLLSRRAHSEEGEPEKAAEGEARSLWAPIPGIQLLAVEAEGGGTAVPNPSFWCFQSIPALGLRNLENLRTFGPSKKTSGWRRKSQNVRQW